MTRSRKPQSLLPHQLEEMHHRHHGPLIVLDYQVTRRQRIHSLYMPNEPDPYSATSLLELLNLGTVHPDDRVLLAHIDSTGMVFACYAHFSSYNPEESDHGQN